MRVAFYGSTAVTHRPEGSLRKQRFACAATLSPWDDIVAVFFDIRCATDWSIRTHLPPELDDDRDGGLEDLLAEAANPSRRFDAVTLTSPDRLTQCPELFQRIVGRMAAVDLVLSMVEPPRPVESGWRPVVIDGD